MFFTVSFFVMLLNSVLELKLSQISNNSPRANFLSSITVIPCTAIHALKPKLLGNRCTNVYGQKACFMVQLFPSNLGFNACIAVQGITVSHNMNILIYKTS